MTVRDPFLGATLLLLLNVVLLVIGARLVLWSFHADAQVEENTQADEERGR